MAQQSQTPPARTKSVTARLAPYAKGANLVYKLMRAAGYVEFFVVSEDHMGNPKYTSSHKVTFTPDELAHLDRGGKVVVAHACGFEAHVKV